MKPPPSRAWAHPGDASPQTRVAVDIIGGALAETGIKLRHMVCESIYVADDSQWDVPGRVHRDVFGEIRAAANIVQVSALIDTEHVVKTEVEAYIRD